MVKAATYVPDAGDLVWLSFSPQAGREQAGRRPALVLSPRSYNSRADLCLVSPITNQAKGYSFEVSLPDSLPVSGVVLSDHVRSSNWKVRQVKFIAKAPEGVLEDVRAKLQALLGL
jgi:mRNA interferase MazF